MRELLYKQLQNLENRGALYLICLMIIYSPTEGGVEQVIKETVAKSAEGRCIEGLCQGMEGSALGEDKQTNRQPSPHTVYTLPFTLPLYKVFLVLIPGVRYLG